LRIIMLSLPALGGNNVAGSACSAFPFPTNLHGGTFMRQAGIRAHAIEETDSPRDNASQVSRATLGLREMLLRGALRPGQRIAEIPLSSKLGVSRTPLRLAFEKLEHEGLIKALPHSGFTASWKVPQHGSRPND
jgi:hypothetical protein